MSKPRLRYTKDGWFKHGGGWLLGSIDFRSGVWIPDPRYPSARKAEIWVGPFPSACEAFATKGFAE